MSPGEGSAVNRLVIGSIETAGVSGVVSVGRTFICNTSTSSKSSTGNGAITGDFGSAPVWFAYVQDSDLIDAPSWAVMGPAFGPWKGGF